jgi:glycosyltransferase involved in cell wall biosynthesis
VLPMNRHAVTPYGRGAGSSRVRVFSWIDRLQLPVQVHSYVSHHNADPRQILRQPRRIWRAEADLRALVSSHPRWLLLHREASPLSRGGLETALLAAADLAIYDFDDALYCDRGEGPPWRRLAPKAPKALAAARRADRVVAGNDILADWASHLARDVVVIPSCVAVEHYRQKMHYRLADPPRLVWIGSADNEPILSTIADALVELNRRTGARLTVIGTTLRSLGPLEEMIDRVAWSEQLQHDALANADVGLMPLSDDPYSRGKCGYKLLQYAAAGLPAVASPVGTNASILSSLGFPAARSAGDWLDTVLAILELPDNERAGLGRRARQRVAEQYSYDAWMTRWQQAVGLSESSSTARLMGGEPR